MIKRTLACVALLALAGAAAVTPALAASTQPGNVYTWGVGGSGQLGNGTATNADLPQPVCPLGATPPCASPLSGATAVSAGFAHTLAVVSGGVLAWGANTRMQLGDGTSTAHSTPVRVCAAGQTAPCGTFLSGVTDVAAGDQHSLALLSDGTVMAWGANDNGELGDGSRVDRATPVHVCDVGQTAPCTQFLHGIVAIAAGASTGDFSLAIDSSGNAYGWGNNDFGALGDGTTAERITPVRVCAVGATAPCTSFLSGITHIGGGQVSSVASDSSGHVFAWGGNFHGEVGDGTTTMRTSPVQVTLSGITGVDMGEDHTVAVDSSGNAYAWGANFAGQLGDGTTATRLTPVHVCAPGQTAPCTSFLGGIAAVTGGRFHSLAMATNGTLYGWGSNAGGELADGTTTERHVPVLACAPGSSAPCTGSPLTGVSAIAAAGHSVVVTAPPTADLSVTLAASPRGVLIHTVTFTATVHNLGPGDATQATVTFSYPNGFVAPSAPGCTIDENARTIACGVGAIAAGATTTSSVQLTVGLLTIGADLTVTATRTASAPPDPNPSNDTGSVTCTAFTTLFVSC